MENKKTFEIIFDKDASGPFIKIKSHSKGSHYAIHRNYIKRNQLGLEENLRISDEIKDYFDNLTINNCIRNKEFLNERIISCNFSRRFENCNFFKFKVFSYKMVNNVWGY